MGGGGGSHLHVQQSPGLLGGTLGWSASTHQDISTLRQCSCHYCQHHYRSRCSCSQALSKEEANNFSDTFAGFLLPVFTNTTVWLRIQSFVLNWFTLSSLLAVLQPVLIIATRLKTFYTFIHFYMFMCRSVLSKVVESEEVGRVFSVLSLLAAVSTSLVSAAFMKLYNQTLATLPGAYLLLASGLAVVTIPINLVMGRIVRSF